MVRMKMKINLILPLNLFKFSFKENSMFFIQWICFLSLYFSFLHANQRDFCILPFGYKRCQINGNNDQILCHMNIFSPYRQKTCADNRMYSLMVSIRNYAIFYSPFREIFEEFMKGYKVQYVFVVDDHEEALNLEMDFDDLELLIISSLPMRKLHLIIHSSSEISSVLEKGIDPFVLIVSQTNQTKIRDERFCYNYFLHSMDNQTQVREEYLPCPMKQCRNETRLCLGLTPCSSTGINSYLCRIDRLRIQDQFHCQRSCFYTDLIIITSDNQTRTVHQVSTNLLNSCISRRLVFVIIYGRLEIPRINSTALRCVDGSVREKKRTKDFDRCSV